MRDPAMLKLQPYAGLQDIPYYAHQMPDGRRVPLGDYMWNPIADGAALQANGYGQAAGYGTADVGIAFVIGALGGWIASSLFQHKIRMG